MSLAWKSFHLAMYALTSAAPQRDRLLRAYRLHLSRLSPKEMPAEVREDFAALTATITRCPADKHECRIKNTIDAAQDHEIAAMINSIIKMYDAVTRYQPLLSKADRSEQPAMIAPGARLPKRA